MFNQQYSKILSVRTEERKFLASVTLEHMHQVKHLAQSIFLAYNTPPCV